MSNTFSVVDDGGNTLNSFTDKRRGRKRIRQLSDQVAVFSGDNAFREACRTATYHGGAIVEAENPVENGESSWQVGGDGSYEPIE